MTPAYPDPHPTLGRRLVTAQEWANRPDALIDEYAYWFNPEADAQGLDPWRLIEGLDAHLGSDDYDVLFVNGGFRTVSAGWPVYVRARHYEAVKCGS
jgi:hypothetical protein